VSPPDDSDAGRLLAAAAELRGAGEHERAIELADDVLRRLGSTKTDADDRLEFDALMLKAANLFDLGRADDGLALYEQIVADFADDPSSHVRAKLADALAFKGHLLFRRPGSGEQAIAAFDELTVLFASADEPHLREMVANALGWKAAALARLGRSDEAGAVIDALIARLDAGDVAATGGLLADTLMRVGAQLVVEHRWQDALDRFTTVVTRFEDDADPALRSRVVLALNNTVAMLMELDRPDAAAATHREMVDRFGPDAVATFDDVARRFTDSRAAELRRHAVGALVNKAGVLQELDRRDEALDTLTGLIARFEDDDDETIQNFVTQAHYQRDLLVGGPDDEEAAGFV
jgi:tetratricopeptide (TPR) repeat protein